MAILFVTHFLDQVYAVSDRITVLRNGRLVGEYPAAELPQAALVTAMVGREVASAARSARSGRWISATRRRWSRRAAWAVAARCSRWIIDIRAGEVLGLGGLLGSGRTELARLLFGLDRADSGQIRVEAYGSSCGNPADAVAQGFALCPEERKTEGIIAGSVGAREHRAGPAGAGWLWRTLPRERQRIAGRESWSQLLGIKVADIETPVGGAVGRQPAEGAARALAGHQRRGC